MIIAFWSNSHGQARTTSNMIAIAAMMAMDYQYRCLLTQTHFCMNNLEAYLVGDRETSQDMYLDMGIDGLSSIIKLRALDKDTIDNYSVSFFNKRITLLPGTVGGNKKLFTNDMIQTITRLLEELKKHYEMVFIDLNSGPDQVSKLVLEKADAVVVNLCQNKNMLDNYMTSWKPSNKKIMYLIGGYEKNSTYNLHNLKLLYKPLDKKITGIIPYNTEFMDAGSNGETLKFLSKNMNNGKKDTNGYFMECVKDASHKLLRMMQLTKDGG